MGGGTAGSAELGVQKLSARQQREPIPVPREPPGNLPLDFHLPLLGSGEGQSLWGWGRTGRPHLLAPRPKPVAGDPGPLQREL